MLLRQLGKLSHVIPRILLTSDLSCTLQPDATVKRKREFQEWLKTEALKKGLRLCAGGSKSKESSA